MAGELNLLLALRDQDRIIGDLRRELQKDIRDARDDSMRNFSYLERRITRVESSLTPKSGPPKQTAWEALASQVSVVRLIIIFLILSVTSASQDGKIAVESAVETAGKILSLLKL